MVEHGQDLDNTAMLQRLQSKGVQYVICQTVQSPVATLLNDAQRLGLIAKAVRRSGQADLHGRPLHGRQRPDRPRRSGGRGVLLDDLVQAHLGAQGPGRAAARHRQEVRPRRQDGQLPQLHQRHDGDPGGDRGHAAGEGQGQGDHQADPLRGAARHERPGRLCPVHDRRAGDLLQDGPRRGGHAAALCRERRRFPFGRDPVLCPSPTRSCSATEPVAGGRPRAAHPAP